MLAQRSGSASAAGPTSRGAAPSIPKAWLTARELEYASAKLTSIEINGTYYGSQKPASFAKWHDETPDDFVFAVKGPRFATNRRILAEAGELIERFFKSGVTRAQGEAWTDQLAVRDHQAFRSRRFRRVPEAASLVGRRPRHPPRRRGPPRKFQEPRLHCARASARRRGRDRRRFRIPCRSPM